MIARFTLLILIAVAASAGCQNPKSQPATSDVKQQPVESGKLETRLGTAGDVFTMDSVLLSFTVINHADTVQRFCKWETPFEPRLGKYIEVTDQQGSEAQFRGAMARRVMPPPPESYIEVPAHDSVRTIFNLATNYSLTNGAYTIKYSGGGVSGLEAGNEVKITVGNR